MKKIPEYEVTSVINGMNVQLVIDGLTGPRPDMIFIANNPSYGWLTGTRRLAVYTGEPEADVGNFYTPATFPLGTTVFLPGWRIIA